LTGTPLYPALENPTWPVVPDATATLRELVMALESGFAVSCVMIAEPTAAYAVNPGLVPWKPLFFSS